MPEKSYGITADTLSSKHPMLHKAVVELIATNPLKFANLKANLSGRHKNRRVSYGKLFEELENIGKRIEIIVH